MLGTYNLYEQDILTVKQFGLHHVQVSMLSSCRKAGFEAPNNKSKKNTVNQQKLENNISRAKSKIREYALCNEWMYFATFTIDKKKYDRYNLKAYIKDFAEFLHNFNRRRPSDEKVYYLFIPELHKDGACHIHALLQGLQDKDLYTNKYGYLGWIPYEKKFGFLSLSPIKDPDKIANYITKYITKDMAKDMIDLGYHLYYHSLGLQQADLLYKGKGNLRDNDWDYVHPEGYCKTKMIDTRIDDYTDKIVLE